MLILHFGLKDRICGIGHVGVMPWSSCATQLWWLTFALMPKL